MGIKFIRNYFFLDKKVRKICLPAIFQVSSTIFQIQPFDSILFQKVQNILYSQKLAIYCVYDINILE